MFLLRKWLEKVVKGVITAIVAYVAGPKVADVLALFGVSIDQTQLQAGLWVTFTAAANWLKHRQGTPGLLKKLL